jgi:hypothetical protein
MAKKVAMGQVENLDSFVKDCRRIIAKALDYKDLGFTNKSQAPHRKKLYVLTGGPDATQAEARYTYTVIPFLPSPSGMYWLGASLEFEFQRGECHISSASLLIFEGQATDNRKTALIRAEWDCIQKDSRAPHAQPHWHVYPGRINKAAFEYRAEFKTETDVQTFDPEALESDFDDGPDTEWDKAEKFHFAMSSRWHINGQDAHQEEMDANKLLKWLDGCIRYTCDQLKFICSKAKTGRSTA